MAALLLVALASAPRAAAQVSSAPARSVPIVTGDRTLDGAERLALNVLTRDLHQPTHYAAPFYNSPWIRDSFAWGMIPWRGTPGDDVDLYSGDELSYWLKQQRPDGLWITNIWSGWYDETPIVIAAAADSYRLTGDRTALAARIGQLERAWSALRSHQVQPVRGSRFLLYAAVGPHVAADWADQVARKGYATGLEALWYRATRDMASMEGAVGRVEQARAHARFASGIARDINRLLWKVSAPHARNAARSAAVGHYTGWLGGRDYFELDSNFLCVIYGIAGRSRAAQIARFTAAHAGYLLGLGGTKGMPARAVYGDYEPADYARIHYNLADGRYHNAYWPSVGALAAIGLAYAGERVLARAVLRQLAQSLLRGGDAFEWYRADGAPEGASSYQWPARMYVLALYVAYLGIEDLQRQIPFGVARRSTTCLGSGTAHIEEGGLLYSVRVARGRTTSASGNCLAIVRRLPPARPHGG